MVCFEMPDNLVGLDYSEPSLIMAPVGGKEKVNNSQSLLRNWRPIKWSFRGPFRDLGRRFTDNRLGWVISSCMSV